jgi:hypothetical protein
MFWPFQTLDVKFLAIHGLVCQLRTRHELLLRTLQLPFIQLPFIPLRNNSGIIPEWVILTVTSTYRVTPGYRFRPRSAREFTLTLTAYGPHSCLVSHATRVG